MNFILKNFEIILKLNAHFQSKKILKFNIKKFSNIIAF